ncbi:hypothetical protein DLM86_10460 [Paenibacillus flagellatus]|uniref:Uncharacterized protein n=1 Tax=Paenibacillus flagellatus TaxID=2211139 RepID=A0A2V5K6F9_9BACL|nr:hypothetical protein DLM86_10460 [Paenibacillus flagellatus]
MTRTHRTYGKPRRLGPGGRGFALSARLIGRTAEAADDSRLRRFGDPARASPVERKGRSDSFRDDILFCNGSDGMV